jgi:sec-independent protein translocase protein TatA
VLTPVETGFSGHTGKGVASLFGIGSQELLIIFLVVLLLFGADRIPEVARAIGKSIREFKRAAGEIETEIQQVTREKDILTGKREARPDRHKPEPGDAEPPAGEEAPGASDQAPETPYPEGSASETKNK